MGRRTKPHHWADNPELLTTFRTPADLFRKADWNFAAYEDSIFARPCDPEMVMFAALDFCVAIISLRDWTRKRIAADKKGQRTSLDSNLELDKLLEEHVPWQSAIEAIGNTVRA